MDVYNYKQAYKYGVCARKANYTWKYTLDNWTTISSFVNERLPSNWEIEALKNGFEDVSIGHSNSLSEDFADLSAQSISNAWHDDARST